jgi:hypothetical protein
MWIITGEVRCDEYTGNSLRAFYNWKEIPLILMVLLSFKN